MFRVSCFDGFACLPKAHRQLLDAAGAQDFFCNQAWFDFVMANFYPSAHQVRLYALEEAASGAPLLLMPLRLCHVDYSALGARTLGSISHPENYVAVALMFSPDVDDREVLLTHLLRHFRKGVRQVAEMPVDVLRLWPAQLDSEPGQMLLRSLRRAGFWVQVYANSYNRFEDTTGMDYDEYFSRRSAKLRSNLRRRQRLLEKEGAVELSLCSDLSELNSALSDYISVSHGSWKEPESMVSEDILALIQLTAAKGTLRLGILRLDGVAAAAQFWIVSGGVAYSSRLAHHEDYKHLAVGLVLTNFMLSHLLDDDHVDRIDFGYGEEDYKASWMKDARDYYGFLAFNTSTRRGVLHGLKNILGRPVKRGIKTALKALHLRRRDS